MVNMIKKISLVLISLAFVLVISSSIGYANRNVRSITEWGGYWELTEKNVEYEKQYNFTPPDGVTKVYYARANVVADWQGSDKRFYMYANDEECNPSGYKISSKGRYPITFDCSNVVDGSGQYNLSFEYSKELTNVQIDWEFVYLNDPNYSLSDMDKATKNIASETSLEIHGTEYSPNDMGKTFLQLTDDKIKAINEATCFIDIYYPNNTIWYQNAPMWHLENGLYYYEFQVPQQLGVYMTGVECDYQTFENPYYSYNATFDPDTDDIIGDHTMTHDRDNVGHTYDCDGDCVTYHYNISDLTNVTDITVYWSGKLGKAKTLTFYAYNFTSGTWYELPNTAIGYGENIQGVESSASNVLTDDFINSSGELRYRLNTKTVVKTDLLEVNTVGLESQTIQHIRGSGEIHNTKFDNESVENSFFSNVTTQLNDMEYRLNNTSWTIYENINGTMYEIKYQMLNNTTIEMENNKNEIINRINQSDDNITNQIDGLNNSLYEVKHQMLDNLTIQLFGLENNIISTLNNMETNITNKVEDSENDIIDVINDLETSLFGEFGALNNSLYEVKHQMLDNLTTNIDQSEQNIIDELSLTEQALKDYLGEQVAGNITANVTAKCNPREVWKYFYVHPLENDELNTLIGEQ